MASELTQLDFSFGSLPAGQPAGSQAAVDLPSSQRADQTLQALASPHTWNVNEEALASLWQKGRKAWKDVTSATAWVETLRDH